MQIQVALQKLAEWRRVLEGDPANEEYQFFDFCLRNLGKSKSQTFQDLFALFELGMLKGGYFVEFGAGDGVYLSNTHMLEFEYGWKGVLSEPAKAYQQRLRKSRHCYIDHRCVWSSSGATVAFAEAPEPELSTIAEFTGTDRLGRYRNSGAHYDVPTVSLTQLLDEYRSPRQIDYMSVDTEGSELAILEAFDFEQYNVRLLTVEHNYTDMRGKILTLLESKGFRRKFPNLSMQDDWFTKLY